MQIISFYTKKIIDLFKASKHRRKRIAIGYNLFHLIKLCSRISFRFKVEICRRQNSLVFQI